MKAAKREVRADVPPVDHATALRGARALMAQALEILDAQAVWQAAAALDQAIHTLDRSLDGG